jgi:hypothetical protein
MQDDGALARRNEGKGAGETPAVQKTGAGAKAKKGERADRDVGIPRKGKSWAWRSGLECRDEATQILDSIFGNCGWAFGRVRGGALDGGRWWNICDAL